MVEAVNQNYLDRNESDDGFNDPGLWDKTADENEEDWLAQPPVVLFEWLGRRDAGLYSFMRAFVFIPVGFDREGVLR